MIEKVFTKRPLHDRSGEQADREYWLSRPPGERMEAVEIIRREFHGRLLRRQRVVRVIQLIANKKAAGRPQDLADAERLEGPPPDQSPP